jgi:hypothetical protein
VQPLSSPWFASKSFSIAFSAETKSSNTLTKLMIFQLDHKDRELTIQIEDHTNQIKLSTVEEASYGILDLDKVQEPTSHTDEV